MTPSKVKIFIAMYSYSGNGGISSVIPEIALWLTKNYYAMRQDPRIESVVVKNYSDTPITMTRNRAVRDATALGCDMLLMLDSDNEADAYLGHEPDAKPFWETSFNFAYERLLQGLPTVVAAPYCGPPPNPCPPPGIIDHGEVPYLFQWTNTESDAPDCQFRIDILTRLEASRLKGIYPMAALPTGVCLFTLNCFEGMKKPYFRYEMNEDGSEKRSTEDVVATRDISLYWMMTKGITAIWANCDAWAFHHKPKKVGKPKMVMLEAIGQEMREAILTNRSGAESVQYVDFTKGQVPRGEIKPIHDFPYVTARTDNHHQLSNDYKYEITPSVYPDTPPPPADLDISKLPRRTDILRHDQDYVYITDEELKEAEQLAQMEQLERLAAENPVHEMQRKIEQTEAAGQLWIDEKNSQPVVAVDPDYTTTKSNGQQGLKYRMIGQRKVAELGATISEDDVENIQALTTWLVQQNGGNPIEVAVAHAGAGQSAAAIEFHLPEGSHLYALDSVNTHQFSSEPADNFTKSFQSELESGRVMADLYGRKFPWPEGKEHLNFVFIERSMNGEKLNHWGQHLVPGGILAGLGYTSSGVKRVVDEFALSCNFKVQASGDVWAVQA